jgi:hypothetical protein
MIVWNVLEAGPKSIDSFEAWHRHVGIINPQSYYVKDDGEFIASQNKSVIFFRKTKKGEVCWVNRILIALLVLFTANSLQVSE